MYILLGDSKLFDQLFEIVDKERYFGCPAETLIVSTTYITTTYE